ncbi:hypothetical protein SISSUDRAFT_1065894 [Sistotremastrum suecicum HHB10207 ss-3]|uniref:DUF7918 domain-containing protein n=1 Tax=Sistotremastrum suecicum HHB10207 ss-3 TaxID=1314776 RepID=A0A165YYY3_9AGAM|nr:hypothetical protein SISSUDRAFT_1065894 [Sistotremastrum suecicum HHB10207 ss-3]
MPNVEGFQTWIEIENTKLTEYKTESTLSDDSDDEPYVKTTCHVPSEAEKSFRIVMRIPQRPVGHSILAHVSIDGVGIVSKRFDPDGPKTHIVTRCRVDNLHKRQLMFGKISLTDDDAAAEKDTKRISSLGTICVRMTPIKITKSTKQLSGKESDVSQGFLPVYEQHKKGSNHCLQLGRQSVKAAVRRPNRTEFRRVQAKPTYEFLFHYAPQEWLQAKGIIVSRTKPQDSKHEQKCVGTALESHSSSGKKVSPESRQSVPAHTVQVPRQLKVRTDIHTPLPLCLLTQHYEKTETEKKHSPVRRKVRDKQRALPILNQVIDLTGDDD